jgi:two-component system, chemotaxis family, sensor kinase CheA
MMVAISREAFIGNYLEETLENIQAIEQGILKLKKDPENEEILNGILRALHTVKGSSRMLKFPGMEQIAHAMENLLKGVREQRYTLTPPFIQVMFMGCDLLKGGAAEIRRSKQDHPSPEAYLAVSERIYANEPFDLESLRETISLAVKPEEGASAGEEEVQPEQKNTPLPSGTDSGEYESIRVKLDSIENIMNTMNQIVIKQFQFKKIQEDLTILGNSFQEHMNELRKSRESVTLYRDFQEIQKGISNIRKGFSDQIMVIERNTYELQEQLMRLTMLPLELIFGSIPRMVEEVSTLLGKDVNCTMIGLDVLLDKTILEKLHDPIIHIVRNSLDHGLESPDERKAKGKSPRANLQISCVSEGGNIIIRIADDGRGVDHEKIKRQALERGLVSREQLEELSESDIYGFLFTPGFSTKEEVTDLSGRGVGLDIVRHNIHKVKGKITINSTPGEGTEFVLSLPLSLATVSGFFIRSGGSKTLIPSNFVDKIVRLDVKDKLTYYNKEAFKLGDQIVPLYPLFSLMGTPAPPAADFLYVVVLESVGEKIGVIVDSILQHVQLIYKPLPRNLQKLKLLQGIVFDETYSIINILFVPELIKAFKNIKSMDFLRGKLADRKESRRVLIVDDSLNTREIEKSILEMEDFEVFTAIDGIDGLERLKEQKVDLVITDIEMPRMDGITMIENIRKEERFRTLPIIVVSSHMEEEFRKKVLGAGANAYIVKSEFDRNSLAGIARRLT